MKTGLERSHLRGPYGHWGRHSSDWVGTWRAPRTNLRASREGKGFRGWEGPTRNARNNVYAGRDGNVYRHDVNGWSRRKNRSWNQVEAGERPSSRGRSANTYSGLQRDRSSRSQGSHGSRSPRTSRTYNGNRVTKPGSYSRPGGSRSGSRRSPSRGSGGGSWSHGVRGGFR
jgi:hypothetical protein